MVQAYVDFDHGSSASTEYRYFGLLLTCWYMGYFLTDTWFLVTSFRVLLHGYFYVHLFQEADPVAAVAESEEAGFENEESDSEEIDIEDSDSFENEIDITEE